MSSHYFVKEGQEPALVILDPMPFSVAADLLAWAPLVVVSDRALETVLTWGIKVDIVLDINAASKGRPELLELQQPLQIISAEDLVDGLKKMFHYLHATQHSAAAILADDPKAMISLVESIADMDITVQNEVIRWSRITHDFNKWFPAGTRFQLLSQAETGPSVHGVAKQQNGEFECIHDGIIQISAASPVWLGEFF